MRPLKTDRAETFERRILDVESTGLGTPVDPKSSLVRPPRILLTVVRYPDGRKVRFWGPQSTELAVASLIDETADGQDIEVAAHFGGSFDFRLCLKWLLETYKCRWRFTRVSGLPLSIEGVPLSSNQLSAISSQQDSDPDHAEGRELKAESSTTGRFRLLDTYRILPGKLEEIGKAVGVGKGEWDHGSHATREYANGPTAGRPVAYRLHAPICYRALAEYCELDTDVLEAGLENIESFASSHGVRRRNTIASTSTASIRARLTEETIAVAPPDVREVSKLACFGGRVEVFQSETGPLTVYDIQSSYPKAMTQGLPWRFIRSRPVWDGEPEAIVEAVVTVPECYVPVLPVRAIREEESGRVYFPTGTFRGVFYGGELAYAVDIGAARIEAVEIAHFFTRSMIMGEFAEDVWARRRVATGFLKYALKIWLNSAYGKLNEKEEKDEIVVRPASYICERHRTVARRPTERCGCMEELSRELGLYSYKFRREPSFHAPWAAAAILGGARVNLHRYFMEALNRGGMLAYCDSVTADRTVVLKRPDGRTCIEPIGRVAERATWSGYGDKERGLLAGWKALAVDHADCRGWFDLEAIIRHRVDKEAWRISAKDGQTEVTSDHGIMMGGRAVRPEEFVAAGAPWQVVSAEPPVARRFDLLEFLVDRPNFQASADGDWIELHRASPRQLHARFWRFYEPGSAELGALLRVVGAFVSEGSASIKRVTACRDMFTISQKRRGWLEEIRDDLYLLVEGVDLSIIETANVWSLRSGASFLPALFAALCGIGPRGKKGSEFRKLPEFCYELSDLDFKILWTKLVEGDGSKFKTIRRSTDTPRRCATCGQLGHQSRSCGKTHTGQVAYTTMSQQLAAGISYLLDQHGIEHAIDARADKRTWSIRTRPEGSGRRRRKVRVERRRLVHEMVYDLQVSGAHTFVDGIGRVLLHNTDSLPTNVEMPTEKGVLGALSAERKVSRARFVAPKLYGYECIECDAKDKDGQPVKHPHDVVRAKGFSRLTMADLERLICCPRCGGSGYRGGTAFGCPDCEGGSLLRPGRGRGTHRFERSEGLGESLKRRRDVDYRRILVTRSLRDTRPKRAEGGSRPWTVDELAERWAP